MAINVRFEIPGFTQAQYDAIIERLQNVQAEGRQVHVAGPTDTGWFVLDVWDSPETLNAFVQNHLGPIFQELGIMVPPPTVTPNHKVFLGPGHRS